MPKRAEWIAKLQRNIERDAEVNDALASAGWQVIRVWESEIQANPDGVADLIARRWPSKPA